MEHVFFDQEAPGVPSPSRFAAEDGVGPDLLGEDLGGGKLDVLPPRRVAVRNLALEGSRRFKKTSVESFGTLSPLGGGSLRAFRQVLPC